MKPVRRGSVINWILIFIIYSAIQVFAATIKESVNNRDDSDDDDGEQIISNTTPNPAYEQSHETDKYESATEFINELLVTDSPTRSRRINPTYRPQRKNCTPPAIEQFPRSLIGPNIRKHGGLVIHVLNAIFSFLGLAIVCNHYFVPSLDRICEALGLSTDVAGATFMAIGSSAPELASIIIGIFVAKDDIGVGFVFGSAVFNIMFVISVCALCSGTVCYLNWWPLVRDCFFYLVSILIMFIVIINDYITWYESLLMLILYVIYCTVLHFNGSLEKWVYTLKLPIKFPTKEEQSALDTYKNLPDTTYAQQQQAAIEAETNTAASTTANTPPVVLNNDSDLHKTPTVGQLEIAPGGEQEYSKSKETKTQEFVNPLKKPTNGGIPAKILWVIVYPIHYVYQATMPDCRTEKYRNWYAFTFVVSMIWISFYSYFMVWNVTIIGSTLGFPDAVMGLTFVAAGLSVPDVLSSIAIIKKGYGDMVVSNAVGSNVFDILICLGLPWFLQTAIFFPGSHVNVISKGLTYLALSLLSTVAFLLVSVHLNGWKLDKRLGIILMIWYLLFITLASLYELNVFGMHNPPECQSIY